MVVVVDPPRPLRIINAATAAIMMITTTIPAIRRVEEDPDDVEVLELVVTTAVDPVEVDVAPVGVVSMEVVVETLDEVLLEFVEASEVLVLVEVGARVVLEVLAEVVVEEEEEPTIEALSSDCIFREPQ